MLTGKILGLLGPFTSVDGKIIVRRATRDRIYYRASSCKILALYHGHRATLSEVLNRDLPETSFPLAAFRRTIPSCRSQTIILMRYVRLEKYFSKGDYQKKSSEAAEARAFVLAVLLSWDYCPEKEERSRRR